MDDIREAFVDI